MLTLTQIHFPPGQGSLSGQLLLMVFFSFRETMPLLFVGLLGLVANVPLKTLNWTAKDRIFFFFSFLTVRV